eukprot:CAMPEP_0196759894 /NCGR_PEP_ID=MMETSP1091-20130531/104935_1 /TAXON_ID=302021 /ORGANISM="Rhodomonas sp., Strain CCMP768" /LENGTH=344 /DNA_ID=CAMNT_0042108755 /DNA_START=236 /DNA_END=1270 /DNA_ORIENTATION=-
MANALLDRADWNKVSACDGGHIWQSAENSDVHLWLRTDSMLLHDEIDRKFEETMDLTLSDMIFLSKHASKQGLPALTVHPIGNPGRSDAQAGGKPGLCVPPSPRIAPLYRRLHSAVRGSDLSEDFPVSLEATHHGPWVHTPSLFAEIGSSEEEWTRRDASVLWADVLASELRLDGKEEGGGGGEWWEEEACSKRAVLLCLGGGHYAPKHGDLARKEGNYLGHILASYAMDFKSGDEAAWQAPVAEALRATKQAFCLTQGGGGDASDEEVFCFADKKAFKSAERKALQAFVENDLGAKWAVKPSDLPTAGPARPPRTTTFARERSGESYSETETETETDSAELSR